MSGIAPKRGEVVALSAGLEDEADPLALYSGLSSNGTRQATMMFETPDRTIILEQAALEAVCRGTEVEFRPLTANGVGVINLLKDSFASECTHCDGERLVLAFGRPESADPRERLFECSALDPLRALVLGQQSLSAAEPFALALLGVLAFDFVDLLELLPANPEDPLEFPDYRFWLAESLIVIDRKGGSRILSIAFGSDDAAAARRSVEQAGQRLEALVQRCSALDRSMAATDGRAGSPTPRAVATDLDDEDFARIVGTLKRHIEAGDVYQIVPSRTFAVPCVDPIGAFARLRLSDPSPYMFYAVCGSHVLFGASPERAVRLERGPHRTISVKPIAGTRRRGLSADEDDRLEAELKLDGKELAEHMMLVDLARNDVAQVAAAGTRRVAGLLTVERYAHVMHLVSSVEGELGDDYDAFHALQACLNVGTLSGAPKRRATELLRLYERTKRGPYGGAIGWICGSGEMDTGVIIRAAVVRDGLARVRAGAGVVLDSDPLAEAGETRAKALGVLRAMTEGP